LKIVFLVKRVYTGKDLIEDCFGRLFHFPAQLTKMGHECIVYALDFKNTSTESTRIDGIQFHSFPAKSFWRLPSMRRDVLATKADVVFSSGDSYLGYFGLKIARSMSAKSVFDIYDDYSFFGSNKLPFMGSLLKSAASNSDLLVCASEALRKKYSALQSNCLLLQNGVDTSVFEPQEKRTAREQANIASDAIVVGYLGSIHKPRGAADLIAAIEQLRANGRDIKLLMAGLDLHEVNLDHPWLDYRGMVDQEDLVPLINACDVVTIPYRDTELIRMTNACKLMEYIACRVPIVVTDVSDYASYFPASFNCVAKPADPASLAAAIANQLETRSVADVDQVLTWQKLAEQLDERLQSEL